MFVDSAPGAGTAFSIYLPRAGEGAASAAPSPARGLEGAGEAAPDLTGTVLLVEDEDAVRLFGARALRNKGYRVFEANNGERALDVINGLDEPLDLIISDVVMPGMDGHTLVRFVRHELPQVKIILISGYADDAVTGDIAHDFPDPLLAQALHAAVAGGQGQGGDGGLRRVAGARARALRRVAVRLRKRAIAVLIVPNIL